MNTNHSDTYPRIIISRRPIEQIPNTLNKWMITAIRAAVVIAVGSCMSCTAQERSVIPDAMAVWRMDQAPGDVKPFAPVGVKEIRADIALTGEERVASLAHGGDGLAAEFKSGLLLGREVAKFKNNALTIHLRAQLQQPVSGDAMLLQFGEGTNFLFKLYTRLADEKEAYTYFRRFRADGKCPVLEFELKFPQTCIFRVAVPLAMVGETDWHDITLRYDGPKIELLVDGVLIDQEWPIGDISDDTSNRLPEVAMLGGINFHKGAKSPQGQQSRLSDGEANDAMLLDHVYVWNRAVDDGELAALCGGPEHVRERDIAIHGKQPESMQYWTPRYYNAWAGDAMCLFHEGRFHLFYLFDRRNGISKYGVGTHQIEHVSSTDLIHWEHHPMAVPITEQWECIGTGWPFIHNGKIYLTYGMHTDRMMRPGDTSMSFFDEMLKATGGVKSMSFDEIRKQGKWPVGGAYAISDDGVHFTKEKIAFHLSENPTIIPGEEMGQFYLAAGFGHSPGRNGSINYFGHNGVYESRDLYNWTKSNKKLPFYHECTCFFGWNGWGYALGSRKAFCVSKNGLLGSYNDVVNAPVYDGLMVPMVGEFKDNRRILAGFMGYGALQSEYGGILVFRELIQHPDGSLGMKWPAEMRPKDGAAVTLADFVDVEGRAVAGPSPQLESKEFAWAKSGTLPRSFHLKVRIVPGAGASDFGLGMLGGPLPSYGAKIVGWQLRFQPKSLTAQWETPAADGPLAEAMDLSKAKACYNGDFPIKDVAGLDKSFELEIVAKYDPKTLRTIVDAQIDGQRTMITARLFPQDGRGTLFIFAREGKVAFENLTINELAE